MKKLLSLILVAMLCVCMLASCSVVDTVKGWFGMNEPQEEITYDLPSAVEYLRTMYIDKATVTPNDYELVAQVMVAAVKYTVDWSVNTDKVKLTKGETTWTVDVDNFATEAMDYTLTATITAGNGEKDSTLTFNRQVPKYQVLTYEQFIAAEDDTAVTVEGVITGIVETSKENDLYLQDENGGYFIFDMEDLPSELGLKVGMTVSVTGIRDTYYGLAQVTSPKVTIKDKTITPVTPVDITEAFSAAEENKDTLFSNYFSMLVTIKGVKVLGQDSGNDSYYNFSLAGKQSYVRISSSTCMLSADAITKFQNNVSSHIYYEADVVGIVSNYGNKIYLVPVTEDAYSNFKEVVITDEEKITYELDQIDFGKVISQDGAVEVPVAGTAFSNVKISWAADNACAVVDNTAGTITFTRNDSETIVKLTVTASIGEISDTKVFTVKAAGKVFDGQVNLTPESMDLASGSYSSGEVYVEGYIFNYTQLGNYGDGIQMRDKNGNTSIFYNTDAFKYPIKRIDFVYNAGKGLTNSNKDMIKLFFGESASVDTYETTLSTTAGTLTYSITPDKETYTFFKLEYDLQYSAYWDEIIIVLAMPHDCAFSTATCTEKATCSICGATQGDLLPHDIDDETHTCTVCNQDDPDYYFEMTIDQVLAANDGKQVKVSGIVTKINTAWSEEHGNITVTITDGSNTLYVYRLATNVAVNDIITITGKVASHNGAKQIAAGATAEITGTHECSDYTEATCKVLSTCKECGATTGEFGEHDYVNGKCSVCEHEEGSTAPATITASKSISDLITSEGWTSSTTGQTFKLDSNVTVKIAGGANTGKAYNGDHIRIYSTDSPAGTITISVAEGYELASIKISTKTGTYAFLYLGEGNTDISNLETAVSGSSVVVNSVKNGDNGKQVQVTAIEVVYKAVAAA